jgi:hypothetical protein
LNIHDQVRAATKAGTAQGMIKIERRIPRPGKGRLSSKARPKPITNETKTETPVKISETLKAFHTPGLVKMLE